MNLCNENGFSGPSNVFGGSFVNRMPALFFVLNCSLETWYKNDISNAVEMKVIAMLYPIQTLWEYNVLLQEFPYHLNVNAIL